MDNKILTFMELLMSLPEKDRNRVMNLVRLIAFQKDEEKKEVCVGSLTASDIEYLHHFARASGY